MLIVMRFFPFVTCQCLNRNFLEYYLIVHPVQSAISVFSTLTTVAPDYLDSLANLGVAYIQRCEL